MHKLIEYENFELYNKTILYNKNNLVVVKLTDIKLNNKQFVYTLKNGTIIKFKNIDPKKPLFIISDENYVKPVNVYIKFSTLFNEYKFTNIDDNTRLINYYLLFKVRKLLKKEITGNINHFIIGILNANNFNDLLSTYNLIDLANLLVKKNNTKFNFDDLDLVSAIKKSILNYLDEVFSNNTQYINELNDLTVALRSLCVIIFNKVDMIKKNMYIFINLKNIKFKNFNKLGNILIDALKTYLNKYIKLNADKLKKSKTFKSDFHNINKIIYNNNITKVSNKKDINEIVYFILNHTYLDTLYEIYDDMIHNTNFNDIEDSKYVPKWFYNKYKVQYTLKNLNI